MSRVRNRPKINPTRTDAGIVRPQVISICESERISLSALNGEIQQLNQALGASLESRKIILNEIEKRNDLPLGTLAAEYQYNGKELIKAAKQV